MSLKEKIFIDLKEAIKTSDTLKRDTLRMLNSAIKNAEIEKKKKEGGLDDAEVLEVIRKSIKQRKDSVLQYEKGKRDDLAEKERKEIKVLSKYVPIPMDEQKVREEIKKIIMELGASSPKDFGKAMGMSMKKLGGQAEGDAVKKIVEEELNTA